MDSTRQDIRGSSFEQYAGPPGAHRHPALNWQSQYYYQHQLHNNPIVLANNPGSQSSPTLMLPRVQVPREQSLNVLWRDSSHAPESTHSAPSMYTYLVKIINPKKKSDFVVRMWHGVSEQFQSPTTIRAKLQESFPQDVPTTNDFQLGYMEGNVKRWIFEDQDMQVMYKTFPASSKITLWCDAVHVDNEPAQKRRKTDGAIARASTDTSLELDNVDAIFKDLKRKHPDMANPKLRLWAKMIDKGRHDDYDNPPAIPLITGSAPAKKKANVADALANAATVIANAFQSPQPSIGSPHKSSSTSTITVSGSSSTFSPLSRAKLRRSCLEDLKSLNELYQEAVLSETEFIEQKEKILLTLKDIK